MLSLSFCTEQKIKYPRDGRVKEEFNPVLLQVGALSLALRFQRPLREGIKAALGREACIPTKEVQAPRLSV